MDRPDCGKREDGDDRHEEAGGGEQRRPHDQDNQVEPCVESHRIASPDLRHDPRQEQSGEGQGEWPGRFLLQVTEGNEATVEMSETVGAQIGRDASEESLTQKLIQVSGARAQPVGQ